MWCGLKTQQLSDCFLRLQITKNTFYMSFKQEQQLKCQPGEKVLQSIQASAESGTLLLCCLTRHQDQSRAICLVLRLVPELLRPARSTALLSQQPQQDRTDDSAAAAELRRLMDELSSRDCAHFTHPAGNSNPNPIYYSLGYCLTV